MPDRSDLYLLLLCWSHPEVRRNLLQCNLCRLFFPFLQWHHLQLLLFFLPDHSLHFPDRKPLYLPDLLFRFPDKPLHSSLHLEALSNCLSYKDSHPVFQLLQVLLSMRLHWQDLLLSAQKYFVQYRLLSGSSALSYLLSQSHLMLISRLYMLCKKQLYSRLYYILLRFLTLFLPALSGSMNILVLFRLFQVLPSDLALLSPKHFLYPLTPLWSHSSPTHMPHKFSPNRSLHKQELPLLRRFLCLLSCCSKRFPMQ